MSTPGSPVDARSSDWRLTIPAGTPYDREVLAQSIRGALARWGSVRLIVGRSVLLIDPTPAGRPPCVRCGRAMGRARCRLQGTETCLPCGVAAVLAATETDVVLAAGGWGSSAARAGWTHSERHGNRAAAARSSSAQRRQ